MQAARLPDGRLHLHHGPIDLIVEATGPGREAAFTRATHRFATILQELVDELPALRSPVSPAPTGETDAYDDPGDPSPSPQRGGGQNRRLLRFNRDIAATVTQAPPLPLVGRGFPGEAGAAPVLTGAVARKMRAAAMPFAADFITPMAAVAGAVADEILRVMKAADLRTAYVNNGGDVALHLTPGKRFTAAAGPDRIRLSHDQPARGVATSGWRGRSQSRGIADSVTVLARTAARADAAATMIANAVDLPGHAAIARAPAREVFPDSDLGDRLVTTDVGPLTPGEIAAALDAGEAFASACLKQNLIEAALLSFAGERRVVGPRHLIALTKETEHA